jgi:trimethylamine---corrinoid protein Co-methyltransferase
MEPIRVLTQDQMARIDETAHKILETVGIKIESEEALQYLKRAGCQVDEAVFIVKIPAKLTRETIDRMRKDYARADRPERMPVRFSHVRFQPTAYQVHQEFTVSTGGFCCFLYDLENRRRSPGREDVLCAINLVNHLDQIDYTGLPVSDQTVPAHQRPIVMAAELAKYTDKIGGIETFAKGDVKAIYDIAQVVAGSAEEFRRRPRLIGYAELRSPLSFDRNMVDIFLEYLKLGVPQTVDTMPNGGATAPMTTAGILALGAAETLAALVLAYAAVEHPVVAMDITPSFCDMSSGIYRYAGPDRVNLLMARIQLLAEYYGCPTGVHGGKTDSCFLNEQAGAEKATTMLSAVLAGAVGLGTVGHLENAITFSPVQLVIDGEIARFVRRAVRNPIAVDEETLALDTIKAVGPGGTFLDQDHTAVHFRDELFRSPLFPVQPWPAAHGDPHRYDLVEQARDIAERYWKLPEQPVLSPEKVRDIDAIVARTTRS